MDSLIFAWSLLHSTKVLCITLKVFLEHIRTLQVAKTPDICVCLRQIVLMNWSHLVLSLLQGLHCLWGLATGL